jgi:arylsulfatase A-like enzyme
MTRLAPLVLLLGGCAAAPQADAGPRPPNIVLVFADDLGWGDVGFNGARGYATPHLDRMAREGVRFTHFYVAQAVCSASRAALLTGCYPNRVGIQGALDPNSKHGLHENEVTLAEALRERGYATAVFGKWHLGHHPKFLPARHGFDEYFGLPYSNDMWPRHPERPGGYPDLPLIDGERVVELNPDQAQLTRRYTERAVAFVEKHRDRPFFLYLPHSMPHVPIFASEKFKGRTARGLYGDVIEEIDDSIGRILATLDRLGLDRRTLVIFTSDNGPWLSYGDHAGSAGAFREGKGTTFEGGVRVPCVMRWPDGLAAGTVRPEPSMTVDLYPTIVRLAGGRLPSQVIDGIDLWPPIPRKEAQPVPRYFYWGRELQAIRLGKWKLHLPHEYRSLDGKPGGRDGIPAKYVQRRIERSLFDLEADPGETTNVAEKHPDVVRLLEEAAERAREDLGDSATRRTGKGVRPAGSL